MAAFDELNETFGIKPEEETLDITPVENNPLKKSKKPVEPTNKLEDREKDYQYARGQLYDLVEKMQETMNSAIEVAQQSDSARAFEVVFQGAKHTADIVDKLQDLHAKEKKMSEEQQAPSAGGGVNNGTVNNVYMTGTTADMLKMLKQAQEEDK
ncbi:terminase small subunit [Synechococcus phage S-CREM2]|nr:terminase small subunit [Synechococcus phage S-CREM2]